MRMTMTRLFFEIFQALESQKSLVQELQSKVVKRKSLYAQSLRNLEEISESIHAQRKLRLGREPGVGAELTSIPSFDLDLCDLASLPSSSGGQGCQSSLSIDSDHGFASQGCQSSASAQGCHSSCSVESDQGCHISIPDYSEEDNPEITGNPVPKPRMIFKGKESIQRSMSCPSEMVAGDHDEVDHDHDDESVLKLTEKISNLYTIPEKSDAVDKNSDMKEDFSVEGAAGVNKIELWKEKL